MPKWLVQTLCDSKLDAPLPTRTHFGSQHHASDYFALVVMIRVCIMKKSLFCLKRHKI